MRRTTSAIGARLPHSAHQSLIASFSTFSGDGRGRGASPFSRFNSPAPDAPPRAPGHSHDPDPPPPPPGHGHGRGRGGAFSSPPPTHQPPVIPSIGSFVASTGADSGGGIGRGRGAHIPFSPHQPPPSPPPTFPFSPPPQEKQAEAEETEFTKRISFSLEDSIASNSLPGAGRGGGAGPAAEAGQQYQPPPQEANRHIRSPPQRFQPRDGAAEQPPGAGQPYEPPPPPPPPQQQQRFHPRVAAERPPPRPKMSMEDAVKHALEVLAKAGAESGRGPAAAAAAGRGRGRGRGRGEAEEASRWAELYVYDDADGERFEKRVGREVMKQLNEGFEEVVARALPSAMDEAYSSALDLKCRLEFEPEFLMGDLDSNPDIEEKEPIPLKDALEKVKPFLMAYEGMESQEEWEEIVEETIEKVPELKKIVDHYSGPDRVTAKKQQEELDRVAKTLPESVPNSIKQFTDRAVLSLQSNPGWGFHRKSQFMDKLVSRMSQRYK